ncbi:hypothetical protein B0T16DRAFT_457117 [Cercophora newfieldiana]|uniref:Cytochrome P450 n=1 Tax=Cercophora newfieldiana TaxID=92897 RepID=A0AA40CT55_9PEZI|nr:hypothetical protein B0T16DRAFT_457117 [Cercophora newfieldiana]
MTTVMIGFALLFGLTTFALWPAKGKKPPMLPELIPFLSNTYQFAANMNTFIPRLRRSLENSNIVGFYLAGMRIDFEMFFLVGIINVMGATPDDVAKFAGDKSGRLATPLPGTENTPQEQRYLHTMHSIMHKYLSQTQYANGLAVIYERFFLEELDEHFPHGESKVTGIYSLIKQHMTKAAILSLQGRHIFRFAPGVVDLFWEYDKVITTTMFGPPKWMFPKQYAIAERYCGAMARYLQDANASFDWNGPDAEADWEPIFGARFTRKLAKWMNQSGFSPRTQGGFGAVVGMMA